MNRRHVIIAIGLFTIAITFMVSSLSCQTKKVISGTEQNPTVPLPSLRDSDSKILTEKSLLAYIISANTVKPNSKSGVPFNTLDYDKIIAYDFGDGYNEEAFSVIDDQGKFIDGVFKQKALSQVQANKILSALTDTLTYGDSRAICFNPRLALVFFKENKEVNQINICMDCNYLVSEIDIPAKTHYAKATEDGYVQTGIGFSKAGRNAIINLSKELKFRYGALEE